MAASKLSRAKLWRACHSLALSIIPLAAETFIWTFRASVIDEFETPQYGSGL